MASKRRADAASSKYADGAPLVWRAPGQPSLADATGVAWSFGDTCVFVATLHHRLYIFDSRTGEALQAVGLGEPILSVSPLPDGVVVVCAEQGRGALRWTTRGYDGVLGGTSADTTRTKPAAAGRAPAGAPRGRTHWARSKAGDRYAAIHDGHLELWPAPRSDGVRLAELRARFADARPQRLTPAEEDELRAETSRRALAGDFRGALTPASRLLLFGDPIVADFVARALVCRGLDDEAGYYVELSNANRSAARISPDAGVDYFVDHGLATKLKLELMFEAGLVDPDDWRWRTHALRWHNVAFAAVREASVPEALSSWIESLAIRPTAVAWYYAALAFLAIHDLAAADWCFEQLDGAPADEVHSLLADLDRDEVARLRAQARAGAGASGQTRP